MEVTGELVAQARRGRVDAAEEILAAHYSSVWRIATGLTGRADVGRGVARHIMQRSLRAMRTWTDEAAAMRWFHHHTLQTTRRAAKHEPQLSNDIFLRENTGNPGYVASVRALRSLPMQQREAFILSDLEKLGARSVAVAMDCSMIAAETHLSAARSHLRELAGPDYGTFIAKMADAYRKIGPEEQMSVQHAKARIHRILLPWRILQAIKFVGSLILLLATIWLAFELWKVLKHSM